MDLTFPKARVRELLEHSKAATTRRPSFTQLYEPTLRKDGREPGPDDLPTGDDVDPAKIPPGLWLVGDQGVYLMSNATMTEGQERADLVYAAEVDPEKLDFDTWWANKRASFGGDDGVEFLEADLIERWLEYAQGDTVHIRMTPESMEFLP